MNTTIPEDATNISIFRDGTAWCAVYTESFVNLQESPAGFGGTPLEAIQNLFEAD